MAFRPHRFGRYIIVDPIAVGGMAEIYRARLAGAKDSKEGPDRIIIIKKVIANLSQNPEFLQMFEAEIKITVGLTNPNIVQIYDYGRAGDQSFLAMEYVEGKNLRQFITRLADAKSMFSIDMSCHIVSQICQALSYAHNFKDRFTGKSLHIVHRDISPQNIMISYEGSVKLFDFGIAKAKSAGESTRAGVIKGKPSYLSPEQINGEELDGRSDIFALGIVLWELLTAKRLFVAENDMAILRMIQSAKIEAPSTFNPAIPQTLDAIVLKSLARDREKRYQTAEEFQRDLHRFLYSFNPGFNPSDLSYYAKELFEKEIIEDRERLLRYLAIPPIDDGQGEAEEAAAAKNAKPKKYSEHKPIEGIISTEEYNRAVVEQIHTQSRLIDTKGSSSASIELNKSLTGSSAGQQQKTPPAPKLEVTSSSKWINNSGVPPTPGKKSGSDVIPPWAKESSTKTNYNSAYTAKRGSRTTQTSRLEAEMKSGSGGIGKFALFAAAIALVFLAGQGGFLAGTPLESYFNNTKSEKEATATTPSERAPASNDDSKQHDPLVVHEAGGAPALHSNQTLATAPATGQSQAIIIVKTNDAALLESLRVMVNNLPVKLKGNQLMVPIKTHLNIKFMAPNYESSTVAIEVPEAKIVGINVDLKAIPTGVLDFTTVPEAKITFYSDFQEPVVAKTPLVNFKLADGKYRVVLENELMGYHSEFEIKMQRDKRLRLPDKSLN